MKPYRYDDQLESARLRTRRLTLDDVTTWAEFFRDPEATEFIPTFGLSSSDDRAKNWIDRQLARYAENRYGLQALIDRKTGNFIGQCGLLLQEVNGATEVEVGYHILKKYWGQGYAPEAASLFMDYAFTNDISDTIVSIIDTKNLKSQKVAKKNGLTRGVETIWLDMNIYLYRIDKAQWGQNKNKR